MVNNRGFTLVELLAVLVIIAILGGIAIPGVLSSINTSKDTSYKIMINDIIIASQSLYEEVSYGGRVLYKYDNNGKTNDKILINGSKIMINLQTLVSNGFLTGANNCSASGSADCKNGENKNLKILWDSKASKDIGDCEIKIIQVKDTSNNKISYEVESANTDAKCPTKYEKE